MLRILGACLRNDSRPWATTDCNAWVLVVLLQFSLFPRAPIQPTSSGRCLTCLHQHSDSVPYTFRHFDHEATESICGSFVVCGHARINVC